MAPLNLTFQPPLELRSLAIRVEDGNPGVRLLDLQLDGHSIGDIADFLGLGERLRLNLRCFPRAYFVTGCKASEEASALDELSCWSNKDGILLPDCNEDTAPDSSNMKEIPIILYEPEEVVLQGEIPRDGYVVLADSYYPGWRAELDSNPVPVLRAQHALRAVAVPAGRHTIRFFYRPRSFTIGLTASLLTILALPAIAVVRKLLRRARQLVP